MLSGISFETVALRPPQDEGERVWKRNPRDKPGDDVGKH